MKMKKILMIMVKRMKKQTNNEHSLPLLIAFVYLFKCFWNSDKIENKMVRLTNKIHP